VLQLHVSLILRTASISWLYIGNLKHQDEIIAWPCHRYYTRIKEEPSLAFNLTCLGHIPFRQGRVDHP